MFSEQIILQGCQGQEGGSELTLKSMIIVQGSRRDRGKIEGKKRKKEK